jgi:hypothetical protein
MERFFQDWNAVDPFGKRSSCFLLVSKVVNNQRNRMKIKNQGKVKMGNWGEEKLIAAAEPYRSCSER